MAPKFTLDDLKITLYDANTDRPIKVLEQNEAIPIKDLQGKNFTIVVEVTDPALAKQVDRIKLTLGDEVRTEGSAPYALFGDIGLDLTGGGTLDIGKYAFGVEVFGAKGQIFSDTLDFSVTQGSSGGGGNPPASGNADYKVVLIDTDTDEVLAELDPGDTIPRSLINGRDVTLSVEATDAAFAADIGSVRMTLGNQVQIENAAPYALFGNSGDDFLGGTNLGKGDYALKLEFFEGKNATGQKILTDTAEFTVKGGGGSNPDPDPTPGEEGVYQGENGRIVMEAENGDAKGDWEQVRVDGEDAMLWDAASSSYKSVPKNQSISFEFQTDEGGNYFIGLSSARDKSAMSRSELFENNGKARTDTGNDIYIKIKDAETGETVLEPTKLFTNLGGSDKKLDWGDTFDIKDKKSPAKVNLDGDTKYELEIIGRSDGYVLDKITLNKGKVLTDDNAKESVRGDGDGIGGGGNGGGGSQGDADNSIGTDYDFNGVRLWVSNDISEIDDAASTPALFLGAKNIADSDDNVTGSAGKMTLEGAYIDTVKGLKKDFIDDVEKGATAAANRYDIDVYSPRNDIDIGGKANQLKKAMTKSLDTAFANGEQVIVIAGGPTEFSADVVSDWLDDGSKSEQAEKALWALRGGFSQVSHGDKYRNNNELDATRDPSVNYFNISKGKDKNGGRDDFIQEQFEDLYDKAFDVLNGGFSAAEIRKLDDDFIEDSFLISLEDQNQNSAVRGPENRIDDTIADDLARDYAKRYDKGKDIDISDVGMLGILIGDGTDPLDANDMRTFMTDDFLG